MFTANDGLTEVLGVRAAREALRLTPSPKSFRIEDRPPGLTVWVEVYPRKPEILAECNDLIQQQPLPVKWTATRGLVTLSVSKENPAPPPLECYTVDVTLQGVAFAMPGGRAEAVLERLELTGVTVGSIAPYDCRR